MMFEIGNETDFILSEVKRLRLRYPKVKVAPMIYKVENNRLYLLKEK
jgi:carbonic anhydrase